MPAHIIYSAIDPVPVGFSIFWLQRVLRQELNFEGAIFSDDLCMQGASEMGTMPTRTLQALQAGCDMVLICNDRENAIQTLDELARSYFVHNPESVVRLQRMRGRRVLTHAELLDTPRWQTAAQLLEQLGTRSVSVLG